jgi:hypothetical protein
MKKMAATVCFILALIGPSLAQNTPTAKHRPPTAQAKAKQPAGCTLVGSVRGTKLWAGNCVSAEAAPPAAEPEQEQESKAATPGGKE